MKKKVTLKANYSKWRDEELLSAYKNEKGGIPLALVNEIHKRKLVKTYKGTYNSNM